MRWVVSEKRRRAYVRRTPAERLVGKFVMELRPKEDRQDRERIVTSGNGVMQHRLLPGAAATVCGRLGPFHEYSELNALLACTHCWRKGSR